MIDQVKQLIASQLQMDPEDITDDSLIMEDLHADSLDIVEILMALEDAFQIEVPDEDIVDLRTPAAIVQYIRDRKG